MDPAEVQTGPKSLAPPPAVAILAQASPARRAVPPTPRRLGAASMAAAVAPGAESVPASDTVVEAVKCLRVVLEQGLSPGPGRSDSTLLDTLQTLKTLGTLSLRIVSETGVAKVISQLVRDRGLSNAVRSMCKDFVQEWKEQLERGKAARGVVALAGAPAAGVSEEDADDAASLLSLPTPADVLRQVAAESATLKPEDIDVAVPKESKDETAKEIAAAAVRVRTEIESGEQVFTCTLEVRSQLRRVLAPSRKTKMRAELDERLVRAIAERLPGSEGVAWQWRTGSIPDQDIVKLLKDLPKDAPAAARGGVRPFGAAKRARKAKKEEEEGEDEGDNDDGEDGEQEEESDDDDEESPKKRGKAKAKAKAGPRKLAVKKIRR